MVHETKPAYVYVASSSYGVEWPIPFSDPAVASDRCANNPLSERPAFRIRSSSTSNLERKSDELPEDVNRRTWRDENMRTGMHLRQCREPGESVDETLM